jgi:8-amino-7-oxononanoate synthase
MNFQALSHLAQKLSVLNEQGLHRQRRMTASLCQPQLLVNGQPLLAFNSNDYLGLAAHPGVMEALREGVSIYGAGSGASHLISGHSQAHDQLETVLASMLADHIPAVRALFFSTGYMANLGVLSALGDLSKGDLTFFSDELNHASLIDGIRLSRANYQVYAHSDLQQLGSLLMDSDSGTKVVVSDGVFSMDGDLASAKELLAICEQHGAWLLIDDAHGFGVLGDKGAGLLQHAGLCSDQLIYVGTLGKAAGVAGAFVAAHSMLIEWMVQRSRPYIYTTAAPAALAHALLTSLQIIGGEEGQKRRAHLTQLIDTFSATSIPSPWRKLASTTAIQPLVVGSNAAVLQASADLQSHGIWVSAIRAPTVPPNTARLRITLSAGHTMNNLDQLKNALAALHKP